MVSFAPDFFVIGAQKAGTTTLHEILSKETQICLPKIKETHFFSRTDRYQKGLKWYSNQFGNYSNGQIIGEIDPDYSFFPNAPIRMKNAQLKPRFIFILRNPFKRAYSHYSMSVRRTIEKYDFQKALDLEQERLEDGSDEFSLEHFSYLSRGKYSEQILRYQETFPESKFLFIKFEEMINSSTRKLVYSKIFNFIGITSNLKNNDLDIQSNAASMSKFPFLTKMLYNKSRIKSYIGKFIPNEDTKLKLALFLDKINKKPVKKNSTSVFRIDARYMKQVCREIQRTKLLTDLDVDDWMDSMREMTQDSVL